MTVYDLHIRYQLELDKIAAQSNPEISIEAAESYLNEAVEIFIKQRYGKTNTKRAGYEVIEKRTDDLRTLTTNSLLSPLTAPSRLANTSVAVSQFKFPNDYWFTVAEGANLKMLDCPVVEYNECTGEYEKTETYVTQYAEVKARRHNDLHNLIDDPFNKPEKEDCFKLVEDNKIFLYHDANVEPSSYKLYYIREFEKLSVFNNYDPYDEGSPIYWEKVNYWMPSHTHQEIIDIAVNRTLEAIENPRLKTYQSLKQTNE